MKLVPVVLTIPGQHPQLPARRNDAGATAISQDDHFHGTTAETGQPARTYAYDPVGNRTSKGENGSTTTYAAANHVNQIPSATGGDAFSSATYDNNGNLTQMVYGDNSRRILSWDSINRLKEITLQAGATVASGDKKVAWDYNAGSQRYKEMLYTHNGYAWALSSTVYFIWEGGRIIQKRIGGTTAYSCTNYFPEGEIRCLNNSLTRFYHTHDHLGSVYEMTNTAGTVQAAYSFAAYGERTKRWGYENTEIAYTGHWNLKPAAFAKQAAADVSITWFRAYDPKRGVWLSRDPIAERGGINLYGMVMNNPADFIDPDGRAVVLVFAAPSAGAAIGKAAVWALAGITAIGVGAEISDHLNAERYDEDSDLPSRERHRDRPERATRQGGDNKKQNDRASDALCIAWEICLRKGRPFDRLRHRRTVHELLHALGTDDFDKMVSEIVELLCPDICPIHGKKY